MMAAGRAAAKRYVEGYRQQELPKASHEKPTTPVRTQATASPVPKEPLRVQPAIEVQAGKNVLDEAVKAANELREAVKENCSAYTHAHAPRLLRLLSGL
jgi:hypothetical protein